MFTSKYLAIYDAFLKRDAERERRHRRDEVGEIIKIKKEKRKAQKKQLRAWMTSGALRMRGYRVLLPIERRSDQNNYN